MTRNLKSISIQNNLYKLISIFYRMILKYHFGSFKNSIDFNCPNETRIVTSFVLNQNRIKTF